MSGKKANMKLAYSFKDIAIQAKKDEVNTVKRELYPNTDTVQENNECSEMNSNLLIWTNHT